MQEQWKDINGWEDLYEISSLGNIKNIYFCDKSSTTSENK